MERSKTIILPVLNLDKFSIMEQINKIVEEAREIESACTTTEIMEEAFDTLQAVLGLLNHLNHTEILNINADHAKKLDGRKWGTKGTIIITILEDGD